MIDFYTADTPNGFRVELMLEELGLDYKKHQLSLSQGDTRTPKFIEMNPSGRIPVIVDHGVLHEKPLVLTQSVAILLYLAEKNGEFLPLYTINRIKVMEWLFFNATDIATTSFDAFYLAMKDQPEATKLLKDRVMEYYAIYDQQLASSEYLVGNEYSIADIAAYPWARAMEHKGMNDLPNLQRWIKAISKRKSVKKIYSRN